MAKINENKVIILDIKRRKELMMKYKSITIPRKIKIHIQGSKGIVYFVCVLLKKFPL
jgi:hypothetical protein